MWTLVVLAASIYSELLAGLLHTAVVLSEEENMHGSVSLGYLKESDPS